METCERAGVALVILDEPSAAGGPGEGSLDNPTPRQQHEATLGLRQSHHLQGDPVRLRGGGGLVSGIALVDKTEFDAALRFRLHSLCQPAYLAAVVGIGGGGGGRAPARRGV